MHKSGTHTSTKQRGAARSAQARKPLMNDIDPPVRQHMIEEAAYYIAEHRGFAQGDSLRDWLEAESEIDSMINAGHTDVQSATAHLRDELAKTLSSMQDAIDAGALKEAFAKALAEVKEFGEYSEETLKRAATVVHNDLMRSVDRIDTSWDNLTEQSADLFFVWKNRSQDFLKRSSQAVRQWLRHERGESEH